MSKHLLKKSSRTADTTTDQLNKSFFIFKIIQNILKKIKKSSSMFKYKFKNNSRTPETIIN